MERGLPVTRVISRMTLQQILARAVGEDVIMNESNVVNFEDDGEKVMLGLISLFSAILKISRKIITFLNFICIIVNCCFLFINFR